MDLYQYIKNTNKSSYSAEELLDLLRNKSATTASPGLATPAGGASPTVNYALNTAPAAAVPAAAAPTAMSTLLDQAYQPKTLPAATQERMAAGPSSAAAEDAKKTPAQLALEKSVNDKLDAALAAFKADYDLQNQAADMQQQQQITSMRQSISNDALSRGMARSSIPVTLSEDNLALINQAYELGRQGRENAFNANTAEARNTANASLGDIELQFYQPPASGGGGGGGNNNNGNDDLTKYTMGDLQQALANAKYLTPAEINILQMEINRRKAENAARVAARKSTIANLTPNVPAATPGRLPGSMAY